MSAQLPTVRVRHPDDPDVMMIINASDLRDDHVLWEEPAPASDKVRVTKGPRGKWYVKFGKEMLAGPFETEDEAKAAA